MQGIWPILFAFFDASNRLDRDAVRRQVAAALACRSPGVAVLGLATEVAKLSLAERQNLIRWTAEDLGGKLPLAVTINGGTVHEQRALAEFAVAHGAQRLILQPPPVSATGRKPERFYFDFFAEVMDELPAQVGIQNAPEYLGVGLSPELLLSLAERRANFVFVKGEASSTTIEATIRRVGARLPVLNGRGGLELVENLQAGCAGMIVAPDTFDLQHKVYEAYRGGRVDAARLQYEKVLPAIVFAMQSLEHLICYGKRICAWRMGLQVQHDRAPALAPTPFGLARAREHATRLGAAPG